MMAWIYAIADSGYEIGVKVGRDAHQSGLQRYRRSHCYSPRKMQCIALWEIPQDANHADWERRARSNLQALIFPHNGAEWLALDRADAVRAVSNNLGRRPDRLNPELHRPSTY
ncbi:MAG: hypothetical protein O3A96_00905, partial [Proteobacteria bacterium]|nr:hypothetical protein [Pseudomonadota bacterium]